MKKKSKNKLLSYKIKGNRFSLRRDRDGAGDAGSMLRAVTMKGKYIGKDGLVKVGCGIHCGSYYARSYANQDWWLTTAVTKIVSVKTVQGDLPNIKIIEVKVKTKNSDYTIRGY